jgi:dTDP-4-amino-4,6-dideoxygalactose transaminase
VLCALGISQVKKLERFWQTRSKLAALYDQLLAPLAPALLPVTRKDQAHGWHLYAVQIDFSQLGTTRANVMTELRSLGVGTQVHYIPVHRQPYYRNLLGAVELPGADSYYARCLSLPLFPTMSEGDVARVAGALSKVVLRRDQ